MVGGCWWVGVVGGGRCVGLLVCTCLSAVCINYYTLLEIARLQVRTLSAGVTVSCQ